MAAIVSPPEASALDAGSAHTPSASEADPGESLSDLAGSAAHGAPAASSGSSGVAVPGLPIAVLLAMLLHWSTVVLPTVRWRPTVFLALPERPG
jgi:hypothetical protein